MRALRRLQRSSRDDGRPALQEIDLSVRPREIIVLAGGVVSDDLPPRLIGRAFGASPWRARRQPVAENPSPRSGISAAQGAALDHGKTVVTISFQTREHIGRPNVITSGNLGISPLSTILGSTVEGVTVADLVRPENADMAAVIRSVIDERLVLLFPRQRVTPAQFIAFARLFGDLPELKPAPHVEGAAEIKILSNSLNLPGKPASGGSSAALMWHADDTYRLEPPSFMFLLAQEVPGKQRPTTSWLSLYEIYDKLDAATRDKLAGLSAIHAAIGSNDVTYHRGGPTPSVEARREGSQHPLLRAHPESRRPSLFMPRRRDALVAGKTLAESAAIIEPLWDSLMSSDHGCSVALNVGDLVVWDNRFTLHSRDAWDTNDVRTMWRLANTGERPIPVDHVTT